MHAKGPEPDLVNFPSSDGGWNCVKTYAAASRNHHQGIIAFICGTIGLLFASPELLRPSHSWRSIITFICWIREGFRQLSVWHNVCHFCLFDCPNNITINVDFCNSIERQTAKFGFYPKNGLVGQISSGARKTQNQPFTSISFELEGPDNISSKATSLDSSCQMAKK